MSSPPSARMVLGLIGNPVAHSLSPAMQEAALQASGIPGSYVLFHVDSANLVDALRGIRALGIRGVNVTVPHKSAVMAHLDEIDPAAQAVGAVNTIVSRGGVLQGYNTDVAGVEGMLADAHVTVPGARCVVLGAGGAARAAAYALITNGAQDVVIAARRPERAAELCAQLAEQLGQSALRSADLSQISHAFATADIVLQSTSATLEPATQTRQVDRESSAKTFSDSLPWASLQANRWVIDLVYKPRKTTVLSRAEREGHRTVRRPWHAASPRRGSVQSLHRDACPRRGYARSAACCPDRSRA